MSGDMATEIDRGYLPPEIRAAATAYLTRSGNADLLPILGLVEPAPVGRQPCPSCGKPLPDPITSGGRKPCQRRACAAGPKARGVKR